MREIHLRSDANPPAAPAWSRSRPRGLALGPNRFVWDIALRVFRTALPPPGELVGQHDATAAYADRVRGGRDMADQHRRRRARQPFDRMMFCQPEAVVAQTLYVLG